MTPVFDIASLKKCRMWEHAVRFVFGGAVSVGASLIAKQWGPGIGGLFLAFPALLPASLTLVKAHDGRAQAVEDARGARLGALSLCLFAGLVALLAGDGPVVTLTLATSAWVLAAYALWYLFYGRKKSEPGAKPAG
jgi:Protein of unknown function (DUF3147)